MSEDHRALRASCFLPRMMIYKGRKTDQRLKKHTSCAPCEDKGSEQSWLSALVSIEYLSCVKYWPSINDSVVNKMNVAWPPWNLVIKHLRKTIGALKSFESSAFRKCGGTTLSGQLLFDGAMWFWVDVLCAAFSTWPAWDPPKQCKLSLQLIKIGWNDYAAWHEKNMQHDKEKTNLLF